MSAHFPTDLETVQPSASSVTLPRELVVEGGWSGTALRRAFAMWGGLPSMGEAKAVVEAITLATATGQAVHPTGLNAKRVRGLDARGSEIWRIRMKKRAFLVAWGPESGRVISVLPALRARQVAKGALPC